MVNDTDVTTTQMTIMGIAMVLFPLIVGGFALWNRSRKSHQNPEG